MSNPRKPGLTRGRFWRPTLVYGLLALLSTLGCMLLHPSPSSAREPAGIPMAQTLASLAQGQQLYEAGQLEAAAQVLQQVANSASPPEERVLALRNLALVHQQLGNFAAATEAIAQAQGILAQTVLPNQTELVASLLEVQGSIQLEQGQGEVAIATWQQAIDLYTQLHQPAKVTQGQINQAQAMQQLGFHRQAVATLLPVIETLTPQPDTLTEAVALRTLGDSLIQVGNLAKAEAALQASLAIAEAIPNPGAASAAALSLGNLAAAQGDPATALTFYETANAAAAPTLTQVQAQLNRLDLLAKTDQTTAAQAAWPSTLALLNTLPINQAVLFAKIHLAESLIKLPVATNPTPRQIADLLAETVQQARELGDRRSESFALGTLGHLYEVQEQWGDAANLSQQALTLSQDLNALDASYRWQWQLGRIYKAEKQTEPAIAAYSSAVDTLKRLRTDLVAVNPAVQVSFQENVEPIHRDLVSLLLAPGRSASATDLEKARSTIESLQLAELDNFFREACLNAAQIDIDQLDQRAAVIYPVILQDRLEIILSLPNQPLTHQTALVSAADFNATIEQFQKLLVLRVGQQYLPPAQQLYDWLVRPILSNLGTTAVDTLVFVLDGELRNIPMAALHSGERFLLEDYSLAIAPGLQLVNPQPIQNQQIRVLTAGLSEARQGFSALPNVVEEVEQIQATVPASVLLNDTFTVDALGSTLTTEGAPIVHLASHGKFSSSNEGTFVLTWDDRLDIVDLNNLLQTAELNQSGPVELLVLSACQTAAGDKLAALGLAGMAVRSGARSTIATLWQVNDQATAALMSELYNNLTAQNVTKAEALRQAQLKVLNIPQYRQHPFYWAPYVLVGNWL